MINYDGKENFKAQQIVSYDALPVGFYVGKVLGAKVETIQTKDGGFDRLALQIDVAEGEHADHYRKQYEAQSGGSYPAKFKGIVRFTIPVKGSQYEAGQKRALENVAWALEQSNRNYHWDWDESKLKGLSVGFTVREFDWCMERNGSLTYGTSTEIGRLDSVEDVKAGKLKLMKKRELRAADKEKLARYQETMVIAEENGMTAVQEDELPF